MPGGREEGRQDRGRRRSPSGDDSGRHKRPRKDKGKESEEEIERKKAWGIDEKDEKKKTEEVAKPDYGKSGKLEKAKLMKKNGVTLKHMEPANAAIPNRRWRIYVFKGEEIISTLHIHRQSCFIVGRESRIADIRTDHISCSKQHAVIQFKYKSTEDEAGNTTTEICPYIMDLGSSNGTKLNKQKIEARRYYQLLEKDMLNFGSSSRDYVLLVAKNEK
ncbi:hypothetical protein AAMO2058_000568900 [Amorphochlora amoebiformis]